MTPGASPTPNVARLLAERAWLRRLAGALTGNAADADDLAQDTLVTALERAPATVVRPRAWLATVLRNLVRNRGRGERRRRERETAAVRPAGAESADALVERAELVERVARLVLALEEPYRTTILLRFFEDEPPRRVAERMGVPVETARTRIRRGLAQLAERLDTDRGGRVAWAPALALWSGGGAGGAAGGGAAAAVAGSAGVLVMKKFAIAAVLLLLALGTFGALGGRWPFAGSPPNGPDATPLTALAPSRHEPGTLAAAEDGRTTVDAAPPARGVAVVRGVVIDEAGRPAAGVPVHARASPRRYYLAFDDVPPLRAVPGGGEVLARTTSGAGGEFALEGLPYHESLELEAVPAPPRHGSRAPTTAFPWLDSPVVLRVGPGTSLRGRVVDASDRGVAAWVEAREDAPQGSGSSASLAGRWTARFVATDADGRFAIAGAPTGPLLFDVLVPGRAARYAHRVVPAAGAEVVLRLEEPGGTSVVGTVRDETGAPIVGAAVRVRSRPERGGPMPETVLVRAVAGPDGSYRASGLLAGRIQQIEVTAPGYGPFPLFSGHDAPLRRGEETRLDFTLPTELVVEGVVVDDAGSPVADTEVSGQPRLPQSDLHRFLGKAWTARTSADGAFRLGGLPLADVALAARADGFEAGSLVVPAPAEGRRATGARLVLRRSSAATVEVSGTAVGVDGRAVQGASVTAAPRDATVETPRHADVAPDGRFVLPRLDPARGWRVMANAPGYASDAVAVPTAGAAGEPLRLVLRPERRIVGRVVGPDGTGVGDLTVRASDGREGGGETTTAFDGGFRLGPLAAGTWTLTASDALGGSGGEGTRVVVGEAGGTTSVTLRVGARLALGGKVVDAGGAAVPGLQVALGAPTGPRPFTYTDADGRFEFQVLAPGPFALALQARTVGGSYSAGRTDYVLTWGEEERRRVPVEVVLLAPDGTAIEGGAVMFRTGSSGSGARTGGGKFRQDLEPGVTDFDLEVDRVDDAAGRRINAMPVVVRNLRVADSPITIRLQPGREVRIHVLDSDGKPVPGVDVFAGPSTADLGKWARLHSFERHHRGRTGADGTVLSVGLPEADAVVAVSPPAGFVEPRAIDLPRGPEATIVLVRAARISGVVSDGAGVPVAGARVEVRLAEKEAQDIGRDARAPSFVQTGWSAETDASGRFSVDGVLPGARCVVRVSAPSPLLGSSVEVVAGERGDVRLRLDPGVFVEGILEGSGWGEGSGLSVELRGEGEESHGEPLARATVPSGRAAFRVGPAASGRYRLVVRDPAYHPPLFVRDGVEAPATGVRVVLPVARHVVGRVTGDDLDRFRLEVALGDTRIGTSLDAGGTFRILNAREGPVTVLAWRPDDERVGFVEDVDPSAGPIQVALTVGATIEGRVEGLPAGEEVSVEVGASGPLGGRSAKASRDGRFRLVGLPPASVWRITAWWPGATRFPEATGVAAGTRDLVLRFPAK